MVEIAVTVDRNSPVVVNAEVIVQSCSKIVQCSLHHLLVGVTKVFEKILENMRGVVEHPAFFLLGS